VNTEESGERARRVGIAIHKRLSELLSRDIQDPALASVMITAVQVSDDLGICWAKVRLLVGGDDAARRARAVKHLAKAGSRLRRAIGRDLKLKRVPELRFGYDTGVDASLRVEELLGEIAREKRGSE